MRFPGTRERTRESRQRRSGTRVSARDTDKTDKDNDPGRASRRGLIIGGLSCFAPTRHESRFSEGPRKNITQDANRLCHAKRSRDLLRDAVSRTHVSQPLHPGTLHSWDGSTWRSTIPGSGGRLKFFTFDVAAGGGWRRRRRRGRRRLTVAVRFFHFAFYLTGRPFVKPCLGFNPPASKAPPVASDWMASMVYKVLEDGTSRWKVLRKCDS